MTITAADMESKLLTLDQVYERFEPTEGLSSMQLMMDGTDKYHFTLPTGWNVGLKDQHGEFLTDATVDVEGKGEYRLTKDAILAITSSIGITMQYVCRTPGPMIENHLNYWASHTSEKAMKLLHGKENVIAMTKPGIEPFSNVQLVEQALDVFKEKYGANPEDIRADYKFQHDLRRTSVRLIVPEVVRNITSARAGGSSDQWSMGVQFRNSIIGELPTALNGYLFAWFCTNGAISTHASSGKYNRRTMGQGDNVLEWARASVDEILGGLEHELDAVEELTTTAIDGGIENVLADIFQTYRVPMDARQTIISALAEADDLSAYGVMNAITQAANQHGLLDTAVTSLMEIGGDMGRAFAERCQSCHRVQV